MSVIPEVAIQCTTVLLDTASGMENISRFLGTTIKILALNLAGALDFQALYNSQSITINSKLIQDPTEDIYGMMYRVKEKTWAAYCVIFYGSPINKSWTLYNIIDFDFES